MRNFLILSFIILANLLNAQQIKEKALLWEISGNGIESPSYLFGTIHLACEGDVLMTDEIRTAFDETNDLMLEIDMSDPKVLMEMMSIVNSNDGIALSEKLGEGLSNKVDKLLQEKKSSNLAMYENINLQSFVMQMSLMGMNCQTAGGYDLLFLQEAMQNFKSIKGLESIQTQIDLFMNQTEEESIEAIDYMVNNFSELEKQTSYIVELYKSKDIQGLYDETKRSYDEAEYSMGGSFEDLLDNRNVNWIPVIEDQIKETSTFIAFGAAHLAGDKGVINLLREKGYTLTPIFK